MTIKPLVCFLVSFGLAGWVFPASAYEHENSLVNFNEYTDGFLAEKKGGNKPYFLLFSAEWCHWCHEFAENTLVREDVAEYLNKNFVNVFIDVDIHNSAYVKFRATGLPYTVFLNPDGSIYYKYTGTLYGDDFLDVIEEVATEAGIGKYALGMESSHLSYSPPVKLSESGLQSLPEVLIEGVLENFDPMEYGVGKGQKSILPRTFLYLLDKAHSSLQPQVFDSIQNTFGKAIDHIYDPVEGGFFRYAENRNWQIPHYEKFADLNAGAILLLNRIIQDSPSPKLKQAADSTLEYLNTTLFDDDVGTFLSFQIADTDYYLLGKKYRTKQAQPKVMDKIFTDRLAVTLGYLLQLIEFKKDPQLESRVRQSLDFLARMIMEDAGMNRYYSLTKRQWMAQSGLSDHAYSAQLYAEAANRFNDPRFTAVAVKIVQSAITGFYDLDKKIFIDPSVDYNTNAEYLMEMNGLLGQAMIDLGDRLDSRGRDMIEPLISHFSLMAEVLDERLWEAIDWEFTEAYIPYLRAIEKYYLYLANPIAATNSFLINEGAGNL